MANAKSTDHGQQHVDQFTSAFDEVTQLQLKMEDHDAWMNVTGILIAIVSMGLVLAFIAVTVSLWLKSF